MCTVYKNTGQKYREKETMGRDTSGAIQKGVPTDVFLCSCALDS